MAGSGGSWGKGERICWPLLFVGDTEGNSSRKRSRIGRHGEKPNVGTKHSRRP